MTQQLAHSPFRSRRTSSTINTRPRSDCGIHALESRRLLSVSPGTNLIVNPGGESDTGSATGSDVIVPTGWTASGTPTVVQYSVAPGFPLSTDPGSPTRGNNFFSGGPTDATDDLFQSIDLSSISSQIDAGSTTFGLSGWLGGYQEQNDSVQLFVNFQDANHTFISQASIGPVVAADRGSITEFLLRSTSGTVPANTRFAQIQLHFVRTDGSFNDGYADDVSFVIDPGPISPVDTSFGATSNNTISLPFVAEQVLEDAGGNVLAVGHIGDGNFSTSQGVIEMLDTAGNVVNSFGTGGNGMVLTDVAANDAFYGATLDASGNIVAVGGSNGAFLAARYHADGSIDSTFGTGGFTIISFGAAGPANASSVAIEPDGSIVVAGEANNVFAIARVTSSGALDTRFNAGGAVDATFPAGGQQTIATGAPGVITQIIAQGDGRILGIGSAGANVAVVRLNLDGSKDTSFGSGGIATITQLGSTDPVSTLPILEGIAMQPGGSLLVSGEGLSGGLAAVRLTSTGQIDSSFNGGQTLVANFGGVNDDATGIVANPIDGQFVLVGTTNAGGTSQVAVAAFDPDGSVNTTFGTNGQLTLPALSAAASSISAHDLVRPNAFHPQLTSYAFVDYQSDGKVLVGAGGATRSALSRLASFTPKQSQIGNGQFGKVGRKNVKLPAFTLANGTSVTITIAGGTGAASFVGNEVKLVLSGAPSINIITRGGAGTLGLSDVTATGPLRSFNAPAATLNGTLSVAGAIGTLKLAAINGIVICGAGITNLTAGAVSGSVSTAGAIRAAKLASVTGTIAAGQILNLTAGSLSGAKILAGANLGSDGMLGGAADTFGSGLIATLRVNGSMANSFIGAGINPVDGLFGDGDDTQAGALSSIRSLTVKAGVDTLSHFEAGVFPKIVHIPGKVTTSGDSRFIVI